MSIAYVREYYGVPAKVGAPVQYWLDGGWRTGKITGAEGQYLRFDRMGPFHPTWRVKYLDKDGSVIWPLPQPEAPA